MVQIIVLQACRCNFQLNFRQWITVVNKTNIKQNTRIEFYNYLMILTL